MKQQLETPKPASANDVQGWSNPCVPAPLSAGKAPITIYHATSPTCWWSWGYYGTLGRVRLTYGDQVELKFAVVPVYEDAQRYWNEYGLDPKGLEAWAKESARKMGVDIDTAFGRRGLPKTAVPPVLATVAAYRQGQPLGDRYMRALCRRSIVEARDVTAKAELVDAAREAKLDVARFERDVSDEAGLRHALHQQTDGFPNVPLGFYNLVVSDGRGRSVVLDYAFEPDEVVAAIEFLSAGRLKKNVPTDPAVFVAATGPAPEVEIARSFGWSRESTRATMRRLEGEGRVEKVRLNGIELWQVA